MALFGKLLDSYSPQKYGSNITKILTRGTIMDNYNILRLFDTLPNFLFTSSEIILIISKKHGIYKLPHELPNGLKLRILGN